MKKVFFIQALLFTGIISYAQNRHENALIARTYLLSHTVFGTKDSLVLEKLFAPKATYGHSGGKIETREEAIRNISRNRSVYSDTAISHIAVIMEKKVAIVRYLFRAKETRSDNSISQLNFSMMLVWIKKGGDWKLMGRQAVKLN